VTDLAGGAGTDEVIATVGDTTPPALHLALSPTTLRPPNHRMVDITARVTARDACGEPTVILSSVVSDEPDDAPGLGDWRTRNDIQDATVGTPDFHFRLRAERARGGDGRVYTVIYRATDPSGNVTEAAATVSVPR
jgi:hypothetical protein